jgi:putative MFS transporter
LMLAWAEEAFDIGIIGPVILLIRNVWHLTPHEVGLLGSVGTFGIVLGLPLAGWIADHYGRRNVLIIGVAVFSLFTLVGALSSNFEQLIVFRFIAGLGEGAVFATPYLLLAEWVNKGRRGVLMGVAEISLGVAYALTTLAGFWVNRSFSPELGWRVLFVLGGVPLLTVPALWLWLPESPRFLLKKGKSETVRAFVEQIEDEAGLPHDTALMNPNALRGLEAAEDRRIGLRTLIQSPYLKRSFISYSALAASFVAFYLAIVFGPSLLHDMGVSKSDAFLYLSAVTLVGIFFQPVNGAVSDHIGRRATQVVWMFVCAISLFVLGQKGLPIWLLVVAGCLMRITTATSFTGAKMYVAEQFPTALRGVGVTNGECITRFLAGVVLVFYIPSLKNMLGIPVFFAIFAVLTVLLVLPLLFWGKETAGRSVEETGAAA